MFASNLFAFVIIYLLLIFQRLRKLAAKTNVFLNTCTACFLYWVVLSVYFQEGCFESCAISSTCLLIISVLMANKLIIMTLSPIFEVQRRRIEEFKWFTNRAILFRLVSVLLHDLLHRNNKYIGF